MNNTICCVIVHNRFFSVSSRKTGDCDYNEPGKPLGLFYEGLVVVDANIQYASEYQREYLFSSVLRNWLNSIVLPVSKPIVLNT